jgi:hypothetical protein
LAFSKGLVAQIQYTKQLVDNFYRFADGFTQQSYEIDDLLKKTVENLLNTFVDQLKDRISCSGLSVVYQILMNAQHLGQSCKGLEDILMEKRLQLINSRYSVRTMRVHLNGSGVEKQIRKAAGDKIQEMVNEKADSFLDLIEYDWYF